MKKLTFIIAALFTANVHSAAQMWCLNDTTICSYGTPSLSKLDKQERADSIYKMYINSYNEAVTNGTFEAVTANKLIELAKAYLTPPTEPPVIEQPPVIPPVEPTPDPPSMGDMPMVDVSLNTPSTTGSDTLDIRATTGTPASNANGGQFRVQCGFSHMLNDDPIVFPNQAGVNHHHTFYGNTSIDAFSDLDNLQDVGDSTCFGGIANRSAYWHPSLIDTNTGKAIPADFALFYYKTGRPNLVVPPPKGLRIIAGDAHATSSQWPNSWTRHVRWGCNSDGIIRDSIPACNGLLSIYIEFPSCWDGVNLDSPDHKSHMAYPNNGNCPASHPVVIPTITENAKFTVNNSMNIRLSSDNYVGGNGGYSLHADWVNGWNPDVMKTIVDNCLKKGVDCHANLLGNGQQLYDKFGRWETNTIRVPLK